MSPELERVVEHYDDRISHIRWLLATAKIASAEYRMRIDAAREQLVSDMAAAAATEQMGT